LPSSSCFKKKSTHLVEIVVLPIDGRYNLG